MQSLRKSGPLFFDFTVGYCLAFGAVLLLQFYLVDTDPEANDSNGFLVAFLAAIYTGVKESGRHQEWPGRWTLWLWTLYLAAAYFLLGFLFYAIYMLGFNMLFDLGVPVPPYLEKLADLLTQAYLWLAPIILLVTVAFCRLGLGIGLWLGFRRKRSLPPGPRP